MSNEQIGKELGITGNKKELLTTCGILKQNKQKVR